MSEKLYNVGIYTRLSRESASYRDNDSTSLENQEAMLSKFITMMPGWIEKRTYVDDGASGGNFNRQGFQDMMTDVRGGVINLVLVQDLSRFGRNYLEAGKYLEEELPALGCRFVALSDGIDTEDGESDIMPFLNAMNDYYLKNLSDRIKSVLTAKAKAGHKSSGTVPYGYDSNPDDHTKLIVDDYAAGVVQWVFQMRSEGLGYAAIAAALNKEGILPPRLYYFRKRKCETALPCSEFWKVTGVKQILLNEIYCGHTISFKSKVRSYRDKRIVPRDESEWIRVENTHRAIIEEGLWQNVQRVNQVAKERTAKRREPRESLFAKLLVCTDCGSKLAYIAIKRTRESGKTIWYGSYCCRRHLNSGYTACSSHRISEANLKKLVLTHIEEQANRLTLDEAGMLVTLRKRLLGSHKAEKRDLTKERRGLEARLHALELQMDQLYEDKVEGMVSADTFRKLSRKVEAERTEVLERLSSLNQEAESNEAKLADIDRWVNLIKEKSTVSGVDRELLEVLVERIEVGEKQEVNGVKTQDVWVVWKYIGAA